MNTSRITCGEIANPCLNVIAKLCAVLALPSSRALFARGGEGLGVGCFNDNHSG